MRGVTQGVKGLLEVRNPAPQTGETVMVQKARETKQWSFETVVGSPAVLFSFVLP